MREFNMIRETPVMLEEMVADPSAFEGRLVTAICYLSPGIEGLGLSTMPFKTRWRLDKESGRMKYIGTSMLARCGPNWDDGTPLEYFVDSDSSGDKLVVVQGHIFASGYDEPGQLLAGEPYIRIVSCRMLGEVAAKPSILEAD